MQRNHRVRSLVLLACVAAAAAGCQRDEPATPPVEVQSQAVQPANQPTTITGCLKAGDAADTFVVTTAKSEGSGETATYHLLGNANVNLTDHVGRQVQVSGTVKQTEELASRTRAQSSEPAGTSGGAGKPVVETRTEVAVKRLEVSSIQRVGERCE